MDHPTFLERVNGMTGSKLYGCLALAIKIKTMRKDSLPIPCMVHFPNICRKNQLNVGKYIMPMDPMGYVIPMGWFALHQP